MNLSIENQLHSYIEDLNYNSYKIYGVTFDGNSSEGIRLYNAKELQFTPSSNRIEGIDDFYAIEDSPFHTRKCIRQYIDGRAVYTFEDTDPEKYYNLKANKRGARMIAFPKFYYSRPDEWTFLVSSEMVPGFEISPMHCKYVTLGDCDPEIYDYVYVSEFMYNSENQISQPGYKPRGVTTMKTFRQLAKADGMCVEDISTRMMVNMLAIIKYANLDAQSIIGIGHSFGNNTDIQYDDILGHDGYRTSKTDNTSIKVMDLVDWYGNVWELIEGCWMFDEYVYINNDTKTILDDYPTIDKYNILKWKNTGISIPPALRQSFTNLSYNTEYKYLMAPQVINKRPNPFGDAYWSADKDDDYPVGNMLNFGGSGYHGAANGLFYWNTFSRIWCSDYDIGARFVSFDYLDIKGV